MAVDIRIDYNGNIIRLRNENESVMFPTLVEALQKIASRPRGNKLLIILQPYRDALNSDIPSASEGQAICR